MPRGTNWIGGLCASGESLDSQIRKWADPIYNEVIFIDLSIGSTGVSGTGEDWDHACRDFNDACDKLDDPSNDNATKAFILRGRVTGGNRMVADQEIDVRHVHVIGEGMAWGAPTQNATITFAQTPTQLTGGANYDSYAISLLADERGGGMFGLHFYQSSIAVNAFNFAWGDSDGQMAAITDCIFEGDNAGGTSKNAGVYAFGSIMNVIARNHFYCTNVGLALRGGSSRYFHHGTIADNLFTGFEKGIHGMQNASSNLIRNNYFLPEGYLGYTISAGIDLDSGCNYNYLVDNNVNHNTQGTAYVNGGTGNMFMNCMYGTTSGTGTAWT